MKDFISKWTHPSPDINVFSACNSQTISKSARYAAKTELRELLTVLSASSSVLGISQVTTMEDRTAALVT
ncbi:hypothetical protein BDR07DRAFT_1495159 [Suillus spraguei]|nr:hypothetical protein BDR07DRAFT_1495159 [Suillus spraguei]